MHWWLIPQMADNPKAFMARYSTFSARADKLATSPFYQYSLKHRRCVVPISGFYEWQHEHPGKKGTRKTPHYIYPANRGHLVGVGATGRRVGGVLRDRYRGRQPDDGRDPQREDR